MADCDPRRVIIAGAGIAGLMAALSFAARGYGVSVFERAARLEEAGAGLQLSPNATRILDRMGVLPLLMPSACSPEAVVLRNARTLSELTRIRLGEACEKRWGAPYLSVHRSDLQGALLARVAQTAAIRLVTGARVERARTSKNGATAAVEIDGSMQEASARVVVGADGVWSSLRASVNGGRSRFSGQVAWRTTVAADSQAGSLFSEAGEARSVNAFLDPEFHLVAYPVRGGEAFNLAAFTNRQLEAENWSANTDAGELKKAMRRAAPPLAGLAEQAGPWTVWPIHRVDPSMPWTDSNAIALIGDAAHAMTPFSAQGAAMAIEDAETLAIRIAAADGDVGPALAAWERDRRPRIARVIRRGAVNRLAWHAAGPVALARNLFLKIRPPENLAVDLDWLYGWEPPPG